MKQKKHIKHKRNLYKRETERLQRALEKEKQENARLRRTVSDLRRELDSGRGRGRHAARDEHPPHALRSLRRHPRTRAQEPDSMMRAGAENAGLFGKRTYVQYLFRTVMNSSIVTFFKRIARYFRRLRVVRIVSSVTVAILTSLVVFGVSLTVLPFLLVGTLAAILIGLLRARHMNRIMRQALDGKHIQIIVLSDDADLRASSFAAQNARDMAARGDRAVIVVTPYTWSTQGLGGHGLFFTARREAEGLYLVRRQYYFSLRREVLDVVDPELSIVY